MRPPLRLLMLAGLLVLPLRVEAQPADQGLTVDAVLTEIQRGLADAQTLAAAASLPPLDAVTVTLQTQYNVKGGPKFKLLIFSFGQTWERQASSELTYVLKPPQPLSKEQIALGPGLSKQLVDAIVGAAAGVKDAADRKPPLELNSFTADFGFVVKSSSNVGVKFEIVPVSVEAGVDYTKTAVHRIKVAFAQPKK